MHVVIELKFYNIMIKNDRVLKQAYVKHNTENIPAYTRIYVRIIIKYLFKTTLTNIT